MNTYKKGNSPLELNSLNLYAFTYVDEDGNNNRDVLRVWLDENGTPVAAEHSVGKWSTPVVIDHSKVTMSEDLMEAYYTK